MCWAEAICLAEYPMKKAVTPTRTATEIAGKKRFRGPVVAADERSFRIDSGDEALDLADDAIVRGNLIDEDG